MNRTMVTECAVIVLALHATQIPENKSALDVEAMLR
jgi:hypothetical protein